MANTYKNIGNTSALVASLLAVGTMLWFQRSPEIIDAPRTQDEAEIMTAILERHYAMGRTNAAFIRIIPEITYKVAATNFAPDAISNVVGSVTNWYFLRTNSPAVNLTNTIGYLPNAPDRYSSAARYAFVPNGMATYIADAGIAPWVNSWATGVKMNFDQRTRGAIGSEMWWPDQTFLDTTAPYVIKWEQPHLSCWIIPDDDYMNNGSISWFDRETPYGTNSTFPFPLNFAYNYITDATLQNLIAAQCPRANFVWTNYVTKNLATWYTKTNYPIDTILTNISGSVTNIYTQTVFTVTNYVNTREYNTFAFINRIRTEPRIISAMHFAYERDTPGCVTNQMFDLNRFTGDTMDTPFRKHRPQFWSTNKYNDIGRALSLLQWIKKPKSETTNIYYYISYTNKIFYTNTVSRYIFIPTNTGIESITVTTNYGATQPYISSKVSDSLVGYRTYLRRSETWGRIILACFSNTTPFSVDTYQWQLISPVVTNGWAGPNASRPSTIAGPTAPGEIGSSGWWPMDESAFSSMLHLHATNNTYMPSSESQYVYVDILSTPVYDQLKFSANLQECYHVKFSALTNYANHGPAR